MIQNIKLDKLGGLLHEPEATFDVSVPEDAVLVDALVHNGYPFLVFDGGTDRGYLRPRRFRISKGERTIGVQPHERRAASLSWGHILLTIVEIGEVQPDTTTVVGDTSPAAEAAADDTEESDGTTTP